MVGRQRNREEQDRKTVGLPSPWSHAPRRDQNLKLPRHHRAPITRSASHPSHFLYFRGLFSLLVGLTSKGSGSGTYC
jgi:hypothetical protein